MKTTNETFENWVRRMHKENMLSLLCKNVIIFENEEFLLAFQNKHINPFMNPILGKEWTEK